MTATAYQLNPSLQPLDVGSFGEPRPQLRIIQGQGIGSGTYLTHGQSHAQVEVLRRRRFVALVAVTLAVLLVTQLAGISLFSLTPAGSQTVDAPASQLSSSAWATNPANELGSAVFVARPGDTYAAVAVELGADRPNVVAEQIRAANGGGDLQVGERLVIDTTQLMLSSGS